MDISFTKEKWDKLPFRDDYVDYKEYKWYRVKGDDTVVLLYSKGPHWTAYCATIRD